MDNLRLIDLIEAAGYSAESYSYHGKTCVSVRHVRRDGVPFLGPVANIVYRCNSPSEASDLVRRTYIEETPSELVYYWPHAAWIN